MVKYLVKFGFKCKAILYNLANYLKKIFTNANLNKLDFSPYPAPNIKIKAKKSTGTFVTGAINRLFVRRSAIVCSWFPPLLHSLHGFFNKRSSFTSSETLKLFGFCNLLNRFCLDICRTSAAWYRFILAAFNCAGKVSANFKIWLALI